MADLSSYINIAANTVTTANLSATGNVVSNSAVSTTGNITGNYIIGDGSQLTGITVSGSNPVSTTGNVSGGNLIAGGTVSATGNVTGGNVLSGGDLSVTGSTDTLNLTTRNGDANPVNSKTQITFGYNGTTDYPQFIHTRHNAGSNLYNTIELWTSDGTQAGTFPANAILGLTVTNGNISTGGILTDKYYYANGTPVTFGGGTYGNSNVNTLLAAWGSNTISTTGNITSGYLFGNGSQLTGLPAAYGNSNVATLLGAFGSNTISTTGTITAGNTFTTGNAQIGTALVIVGATNTLQTNNGSAVQFGNRVNFNQTGNSIVASGNILEPTCWVPHSAYQAMSQVLT
jgi:hypothetical protein